MIRIVMKYSNVTGIAFDATGHSSSINVFAMHAILLTLLIHIHPIGGYTQSTKPGISPSYKPLTGGGQPSAAAPLQDDLFFQNRVRTNEQTAQQDIRAYELRKQQQAETAKEIDKVFKKRIAYAFPSRLANPGANYYQVAFDTLNDMLEGRKPLSLKKAVFYTEWAYFESTLPYSEFDNALKYSSQLIKASMKQDKLPNTALARNYAIFRFFTDTLRVKFADRERRIVTHLPIQYDFDDFYGEKDWTKGMVTKLLKTQTGQCHSMPLLYLLLAEELGTPAYLANAPEHTYIKIPVANGTYQNLELTNGRMTSDSYVLSSGYIKSEALSNKAYMKPLTKKETVAQSMIDLAKGYGNKFGFDEFYLNAVNTALLHQPNNLNALYMKANYHYWLIQHVLKQEPAITKNTLPRYPELQKIIKEFKDHQERLTNMGYEEMPKEVYASWLKSIEKEKSKSNQMIQTIKESVWSTKKQ